MINVRYECIDDDSSKTKLINEQKQYFKVREDVKKKIEFIISEKNTK